MKEITFQEVIDDLYVVMRYNKSNLLWINGSEVRDEQNLLRLLNLFAMEAFVKGFDSPKKEIDTIRRAMVQLQHYGSITQ